MKLQKTNTTQFYCFSPFVMAMTVIVELGLLLYVLLWRERSITSVLAMCILFALALFQAMEYGICEGLFGIDPNVLARIGFVSITTLPVLGLHLILRIGKVQRNVLLLVAYASMLVWSAIFLLSDALMHQICGGNYIIFEMSAGFGGSYFAYYYFWLFVGGTLALLLANRTRSKQTASSLRWMTIGYASFTVPATLIWLLADDAAQGLPSIMCGFAVLFAIILVAKVLPNKR